MYCGYNTKITGLDLFTDFVTYGITNYKANMLKHESTKTLINSAK